LIDCAGHINDEITTRQELVARLRLINSCRLVLVSVGFDVSMRRKPVVIEDEGQDDTPYTGGGMTVTKFQNERGRQLRRPRLGCDHC
jgi:hypothetical protein